MTAALREAVEQGLRVLRDGATIPAMEAWASLAQAALDASPTLERVGVRWRVVHDKTGQVVNDGVQWGAVERLPKDHASDVRGYTVRHSWVYAEVAP